MSKLDFDGRIKKIYLKLAGQHSHHLVVMEAVGRDVYDLWTEPG